MTWLDHVKKTMRENPGKPFRDILKMAKKTYKPKHGKTEKKSAKKSSRRGKSKAKKSKKAKKSRRRSKSKKSKSKK